MTKGLCTGFVIATFPIKRQQQQLVTIPSAAPPSITLHLGHSNIQVGTCKENALNLATAAYSPPPCLRNDFASMPSYSYSCCCCCWHLQCHMLSTLLLHGFIVVSPMAIVCSLPGWVQTSATAFMEASAGLSPWCVAALQAQHKSRPQGMTNLEHVTTAAAAAMHLACAPALQVLGLLIMHPASP
jgi:hypothetical protein